MLTFNDLFIPTENSRDTIIIKNEFYPSGLTEYTIYNYYMKNKNIILNEINNREIMIFFASDMNKFIVRRKDIDGSFCR